MPKKYIFMTVRTTEIAIAVSKANEIEAFSIPLPKPVLTQGLISDKVFLQSVIETVINRVGKKAFYYLFLDEEYTLVKFVTLPPTLAKRDRNKWVFALLPKLFSLPLNEVAFDFQIIQQQLTIVVASKQIIVGWQALFSEYGLKLKAIGPENQGRNKTNDLEDNNKQQVNPSKLDFNLLPWRKQRIRFSILLNVCSLFVYLSATLWVLVILWQTNHQQLTESVMQLEKLKNEKRMQQHDVVRIGELKQQLASRRENQKSHQRLEKRNTFIFDLLTALAASLPINLSLTGLIYQKETVRVAGVSGQYRNLKKMVQTLRHLPFATDCQLTVVRRENHALFFEIVIQL